MIKQIIVKILIFSTLSLSACAWMEKPIGKVLTKSSNARLIMIDRNRAVVQYDYGALIDVDGEKDAQNLIHKFCYSNNVVVLLEGTRPSGEKQWTKSIVFQCR